MDINWLGLIAGAVTLFLINYFSNKASFSVKEGELKFGVFIKGLGILCFMFSVVPFFVLLTGNYQVDKPGETAALICLMIAFGISAIYVLGEGFFIKGSYDIESILFSTPWTGEKNEKWDDLQSAEFNYWCCWYVLKFKSGKIVRLSSYLGGVDHLLEFLQERGHKL